MEWARRLCFFPSLETNRICRTARRESELGTATEEVITHLLAWSMKMTRVLDPRINKIAFLFFPRLQTKRYVQILIIFYLDKLNLTTLEEGEAKNSAGWSRENLAPRNTGGCRSLLEIELITCIFITAIANEIMETVDKITWNLPISATTETV